MPAIFTHIQFGKEVAATLPPLLRKLTESYPAAFYLGTQGPDILFYHKPLQSKAKNPARKKGWDLHAESPEAFFLNAASLLLAEETNYDNKGNFLPLSAQAAYVIGFLCHFTLDSSCHPYIDEHAIDGVTHGKIESELDKHFLRIAQLPVRGYNAAKLFSPSEEALRAGAKILDVTEKNMRVAMQSMRKLNGLFSHKSGFVHGFCHTVLSIVGMNKSYGEMFLHKQDDERCAPLLPRLEELFDGAVDRAKTAVCDFFHSLPQNVEAGSLQKDFYRYNYSGKEV